MFNCFLLLFCTPKNIIAPRDISSRLLIPVKCILDECMSLT